MNGHPKKMFFYDTHASNKYWGWASLHAIIIAEKHIGTVKKNYGCLTPEQCYSWANTSSLVSHAHIQSHSPEHTFKT